MVKIIINRKGEFLHRLRKFDIYIDEQKAGSVKSGGAEEIVVPAGRHIIYCKLSWYSSNKLSVDTREKDVIFLEVSSNTKFLPFLYGAMLVVLLGPIVFRSATWFNRDWLEWSRIAVLGIVILYGGYYSFFARDKYLRIGEDKNNIFNN